jgi:hypothetical protein
LILVLLVFVGLLFGFWFELVQLLNWFVCFILISSTWSFLIRLGIVSGVRVVLESKELVGSSSSLFECTQSGGLGSQSLIRQRGSFSLNKP